MKLYDGQRSPRGTDEADGVTNLVDGLAELAILLLRTVVELGVSAELVAL